MKTACDPEILFVFPSLLNGRLFEGFDYHLGAGYIRAYLGTHGIATEQFIHDGNATVRQIARAILERRPRLVGFSCYDNNYFINKVLAEEIRRQNSSIPIIFGGPAATFSAERILEDCSAIDVCGRSYCEETVLELVRWSRGQKTLESISGISFRKAGRVTANPDRALPRSERTINWITRSTERRENESPSAESDDRWDLEYALDKFPDPYTTGLIPARRASDIGIVTSRGCTFACTFCVFSAMSRRSLSCHSERYVLRLLEFLETSVPRNTARPYLVTINDDNFSMVPKRLHRLLCAMKDAQFSNLRFWAEMRVDVLKDETFALLREARFSEINFGLESAVPRVLAAMHKVRTSGAEKDGYAKERRYVEKIAWAAAQAKQNHIDVTVSIILGGPREDLRDGQETLNFVQRIGVSSYAHNFIGISAGTALANSYSQWGLKVHSRPWKILPLETEVTYDVYQLKILPHDRAWLPMTGFEMRQASLLFSGIPHVGEVREKPRSFGRGGGGKAGSEHEDRASATAQVPLVLFTASGFDNSVAEWLTSALPVSTRTWILLSEGDEKGSVERVLAEAGAAIQELNTVRVQSIGVESYAIRVNELSPTAPLFNTRVIRERQWKDRLTSIKGECADDGRTVEQFTINDREDLSAAQIATQDLTERATQHLGPELISNRASFKDGCRWCSRGCPAGDGSRWLVDQEGNVRPCFSAPVAGKVGEPLDAIQQRLEALRALEQERRGCATCEARTTCSKCLFTSPLTVDEYCNMKKGNRAMSALFDGLHLSKSMLDAGLFGSPSRGCRITSLSGVNDGHIDVHGREVPLSTCILLELLDDERTYLFSHQEGFVSQLPRTEAEMLRSLVPSESRRPQSTWLENLGEMASL